MATGTPVLLAKRIHFSLTFVKTVGFDQSKYVLTVRSKSRTFPNIYPRTLEQFAAKTGLTGFSVVKVTGEKYPPRGKIITAFVNMHSQSLTYNRGAFLLYVALHVADGVHSA